MRRRLEADGTENGAKHVESDDVKFKRDSVELYRTLSHYRCVCRQLNSARTDLNTYIRMYEYIFDVRGVKTHPSGRVPPAEEAGPIRPPARGRARGLASWGFTGREF